MSQEKKQSFFVFYTNPMQKIWKQLLQFLEEELSLAKQKIWNKNRKASLQTVSRRVPPLSTDILSCPKKFARVSPIFSNKKDMLKQL